MAEWVAAEADRQDLVDLWGLRVMRMQCAVQLFVRPGAVFPLAGSAGCEESLSELSAAMAVGVARVRLGAHGQRAMYSG